MNMNERESLRQIFNRDFGNWDIELPDEALTKDDVWLIVQRGWTIWTRFDSSDEDQREYLDYYAIHRMTNDRHVRLYSNGDVKALPTMSQGYVIPNGASKEEQEELEAKYTAYNQSVEELLNEKGFLMTDQAHPSAQINRWLQTQSVTDRTDEDK